MERCYCGDTSCPWCGTAQGTYPEKPEPDPDDLHDKQVQEELDSREGPC